MAEEKHGIKESKELMIGMLEVAVILREAMKDGFQLGEDLAFVWDKVKNDPIMWAKILAAYDGVKAVPAEVKDIDLVEGFELAQAAFPYLPKLIKGE